MRAAPADLILLEQLALATGLPTANLTAYLSGTAPQMTDAHPELACLRDVCFGLAMLCAPAAETLPHPSGAWATSDAHLKWGVDEADPNLLVVSAFGIAGLRCAGYSGGEKQRGGFMKLFGGGDKHGAPRAPPSRANVEVLAGNGVTSEEDVLHMKQLPNFDNRLRAHDAELLLQYLTVPYLRIPLLLRFFADRSRIKSLASPELQATLSAAVFEPGNWRPPAGSMAAPLITEVPAADRSALATSAGLLINELRTSPAAIVLVLEEILELTLEMDVGRYAPASSPIVLFVLRLLTRVEGYVQLVLGEDHEAGEADGATPREEGAKSLGVVGFGPSGEAPDYYHHAVAPSAAARATLRSGWRRVAGQVASRVVPMLQAWVGQAVDDVELRLACGLHAHLVLLHKNCRALDVRTVSILLSAQTFINVNWLRGYAAAADGDQPTAADEEAGSVYGVCEHELFDTYQRMRHPMLEWLASQPTKCDAVMEAVVRTITLAHERRTTLGREATMDREELERARAMLARRWVELERPGHLGRRLPDTELVAIHAALERLAVAPTYEVYLRAQAQAVDTEINLQLGEYTLKNHTLQALPLGISRAADFVAVFGVRRESNPIQCVEVINATKRTWLRLVGLRHDVQLWDAEARQPGPLHTRRYETTFDSSGEIPSVAKAEGEAWIAAVLEPYRRQYLRECDVFLPEWDHTDQSFAVLSGLLSVTPPRAPSAADDDDAPAPPPITTLKELVVFRDPPVVHVYDVVSHGRRFYRTLVASSDNAFCLHDMPTTLFLQGEKPRLVAGNPRASAPPSSTLLITRSLTKTLGMQTFLPERLLRGLLPAALLESYSFWQNGDDTLTGYPHAHAPLATRTTRLQVKLSPVGEADASGFGGAQAVLTLTRESIIVNEQRRGPTASERRSLSQLAGNAALASSENLGSGGGGSGGGNGSGTAAGRAEEHAWHMALAEVDGHKKRHTLLNAMHAPPGSALRELAEVFIRLEYLSHVLVWSETPMAGPEDVCSIDLVELPRLKLSFRVETHPLRLCCVEHAGLTVAPTPSDERMRALLSCVPSSLLLENAQGELAVLVSATTLPTRPALKAALFSTEVVLDRSNRQWIANCGNAPAYLYPVHVGRLSLGIPTFAAGLYLLLLRFLHRDYAAVFVSSACCVSDMALSNEESQIFAQLGMLSHDVHPDAHACRLKVSLATRGTPHAELCATKLWSLRAEYTAYVSKWRFVSTVCRLTIPEEMLLLTMVDTDSEPSLYNRRMFVKSLAVSLDGSPTPPISLRYPPTPQLSNFDALGSAIYLGSAKIEDDHWWNRLSTMSYARPAESTGGAAIGALDKWLDHGLELSGGKDSLGFLFLYELLTNSLNVRILPSDSPYILGALLVRTLPPHEHRKRNPMMSILRVLSYNPHLAAAMPTYEDNRRFKLKRMLKSSDLLKSLFDAVREFLVGHQADVRWPPQRPPYRAAAMIKVLPFDELLLKSRAWLTADVSDAANERRTLHAARTSSAAFAFGSEEVKHCANAPLTPAGLESRVRMRPSDALVSSHDAEAALPTAASGVVSNAMAERMIQRLRDDLKRYAANAGKGTVPELKCLTTSEAEAIVRSPSGPEAQAAARAAIEMTSALEAMASRDGEAMVAGMAEAERLANNKSGRPDFALAQAGGLEATITFELLVSLHVCASGDATLQRLNPHLDASTLGELANMTTAVELLAARVGHARRALATSHKLIAMLRSLGQHGAPKGQGAQEEARQSLVQRGAALAEAITAKRCYMSADEHGGYAFDPRFLAFEYAFNLLLRKQQAELIGAFTHAARAGESRVHQMIMGAGKTTVVCPLLALMLGNSNTLVMQVVPVALLEFSRSVMRERFSSLLRKPVYTFSFDRFTAASPQLLQKILHARRLSAVMLTTPTSLKSFVLKFIETVHLLESSADQDEEEYMRSHNAAAAMMKLMGRGKSFVGLRRTQSEEAVARSARMVPQLAAQARVAVSIVHELQESLLILDEVDLILHPLKSELNWPLGKRKPLDFGASRWAVPFHLLDALFFCSEGTMPDAWRSNRTAKAILQRLQQAVAAGLDAKHLQRTPHLILISTAFYRTHLKPLLCRWMLLLLRKLRLRELTDEQVLSYVMYGGRAHASTTLEVMNSLKDRHVKMLNLAHAWLDQLLPHVLAKIDRVNYGLLTPTQLHAAGDIPTSRRLLAVPFLGKDVPSQASEFAHPDVVIGFTILAYRYAGPPSTVEPPFFMLPF